MNARVRRKPRTASRLVAIGVSADGITALGTILKGLPANFPAPVLIVQHRRPGGQGLLAKLLDRRSALSVREGRGREPDPDATARRSRPRSH